MFGIGFSELIVIAVVVLIAVGPDRMPTLMRSVGRAMREFRRASNELRKQTGIDDLLSEVNDDKPIVTRRVESPGRITLTEEDKRREFPPEGVDLAEAERRAALPAPSTKGPKPDPEVER